MAIYLFLSKDNTPSIVIQEFSSSLDVFIGKKYRNRKVIDIEKFHIQIWFSVPVID